MASVRITRKYTFEAAHLLPLVPDGHKCKRPHGHTYHVEIDVVGDVDPATGWFLDFFEIDKYWNAVADWLDHRDLNVLIDNPTTENLLMWIWGELDDLPGLDCIRISENPSSIISYRKEPRQ